MFIIPVDSNMHASLLWGHSMYLEYQTHMLLYHSFSCDSICHSNLSLSFTFPHTPSYHSNKHAHTLQAGVSLRCSPAVCNLLLVELFSFIKIASLCLRSCFESHNCSYAFLTLGTFICQRLSLSLCYTHICVVYAAQCAWLCRAASSFRSMLSCPVTPVCCHCSFTLLPWRISS